MENTANLEVKSLIVTDGMGYGHVLRVSEILENGQWTAWDVDGKRSAYGPELMGLCGMVDNLEVSDVFAPEDLAGARAKCNAMVHDLTRRQIEAEMFARFAG